MLQNSKFLRAAYIATYKFLQTLTIFQIQIKLDGFLRKIGFYYIILAKIHYFLGDAVTRKRRYQTNNAQMHKMV